MAKDKKSFVLRINGETMSALEKWAADEFRSVNGQLEWLITDALKKTGRFKVADDAVDENVNEKK
ncbi:MAG: Arc family DNA-binding protein [Bacteroidaceae bacterium]|nr:Arc family DNA-binding protein [Bacteroidaceae bacterium]